MTDIIGGNGVGLSGRFRLRVSSASERIQNSNGARVALVVDQLLPRPARCLPEIVLGRRPVMRRYQREK